MNIVDPRIDPRDVPIGSRAVVIAEHQQPKYRPLPSVRTPNGRVITRWEPTADERRRIAAGEDLFLTILSNGSINPVLLTVGTQDAVACWNRGCEPCEP